MPQDPDCKCKVINGKNGYIRDNSSWILGRIVRDFDKWSDPATKKRTQDLLDEKWDEIKTKNPAGKRPMRAGFIVTVYNPSTTRPAGVAEPDVIYWSGISTLLVQLGIAIIPWGLSGDWGILIITACGIALALTTGLLPQWKKEKWACRPKSKDTYVLTRGNGAQHAIVILGNKHGLNLEDLAAGQSNIEASTNSLTRAALLTLSTFWILLLITSAGLKRNTWFLLAVGGVGILQNIFVAGWGRRPENFGIPLDFVEVFGQTKVMATLLEVEKKYQGLGRSMCEEFFPGKLCDDEIMEWKRLEQVASVKRV